MNCHICESLTDFTCERCKEPVCEDCCVPMTIHNQIDYALCTCCQGGIEATYWLERDKEEARLAAITAKKKAIADKRRATWLKPANIEKRRLAKLERQRLKKEQAEKRMRDVAKIVSEMFRGMF